jgi:hypothetical protein
MQQVSTAFNGSIYLERDIMPDYHCATGPPHYEECSSC